MGEPLRGNIDSTHGKFQQLQSTAEKRGNTPNIQDGCAPPEVLLAQHQILTDPFFVVYPIKAAPLRQPGIIWFNLITDLLQDSFSPRERF
jgi:hypothetical protein